MSVLSQFRHGDDSAPQAQTRDGRFARLLRGSPILQVTSVIVLLLAIGLTIDGFFRKSSLFTTLILASFLGIAAAGETLVILIGGIDLSVPALISGANLVSPWLAGRGWSFGLVIALVLVLAALVGIANGFIT